MIPVRRGGVGRPAVLDKPDRQGRTEKDRAIEAFRRSKGKREDFKFKFNRYSDDEVKQALNRLFHGKCAYCESRYATVQPMDVEHFRPKAMVERDGTKLWGYYWLASTWENLLPSCIYCNRINTHEDFATREVRTMGKGNNFPVVGAQVVQASAELDGPPHERDLTGEEPLLLDPCDDADRPTDHLEYGEVGEVYARVIDGVESPKAIASIRIYGLNRLELVRARHDMLRRMRFAMRVIDDMAALLDEMTRAQRRRFEPRIRQLIRSEARVLAHMRHPSHAYSAMAEQFIASWARQRGFELDARVPDDPSRDEMGRFNPEESAG